MDSLLLISGIIFSFVAIMHFFRVCFRVQVIIGGKIIPLWVSVIGFLIPALLASWTFTILYLINASPVTL